MNLTPKQLRVLRMIHDSRRTQGYSPTMQEIADQLGVSKVTVFEHVEALIAKGALIRDKNKARSLSIAPEFEFPQLAARGSEFGDSEELPTRQLNADLAGGSSAGSDIAARLSFPLVGKVAAGYPIEKFEQSESLELEALFGPRVRSGARGNARGDARGRARADDTFALQVDGMSMRDEGILDGDYVLVAKRKTARDGERVVALLPSGETTLKTLYRESDGRIRLQPANPDFAPIIVDRCEIQGIVIGVLRRY
ncbi:MAG: LexA repressor [Planctomycetota bacterium]